jgi:hypothetical protein
VWHDWSQEKESGNAEHLWTKLFAVEDHDEIISGMKAWNRDGTLPDGTCIGEPEQHEIATPERKLPWY